MAAESKGQKILCDRLTREGWYVTKVISTSRAGFPDLLAFKAGQSPRLIECKASKGRRSGRQKLVAGQLTAAGCVVEVIDVETGEYIYDRPIVQHVDLGW